MRCVLSWATAHWLKPIDYLHVAAEYKLQVNNIVDIRHQLVELWQSSNKAIIPLLSWMNLKQVNFYGLFTIVIDIILLRCSIEISVDWFNEMQQQCWLSIGLFCGICYDFTFAIVTKLDFYHH